MAKQIKRNGKPQTQRPTRAALLAVWAGEVEAEASDREARESEAAAHEWAAWDSPAWVRGCACNACEAAREEWYAFYAPSPLETGTGDLWAGEVLADGLLALLEGGAFSTLDDMLAQMVVPENSNPALLAQIQRGLDERGGKYLRGIL